MGGLQVSLRRGNRVWTPRQNKMKTCENPFFIWFTGRTGSTFLCDLLNSHPQISCRKEQFCEVKIVAGLEFPSGARTFENKGGVFGRRLFADNEVIDDPSDSQTLDYLKFAMNDAAKACGFKLKYPNQSQCYPEIVERLKQVQCLKVIELVRENVLKQAISLRNVARIRELGVSRASNAVEPIELKPLELDVALALTHARYFLRIRDDFSKFSQQFENTLQVTYEDLLSDHSQTIERILRFLNVDASVPLKSQFSKTTPDQISEAVSNFDELASAVKGTELERFLD